MNPNKEKSVSICCIIMASGLGKRFGSNKLLTSLQGKPLFSYALSATALSCIAGRVIVTRYPEIKDYCQKNDVSCILHDMPDRNDTIALGVNFFLKEAPEASGFLFLPADQPCLTQRSVSLLCTTFLQNPDKICRLSYQDIAGTPVIFPACYQNDLLCLPPKNGGSFIIKQHPKQVLFVPAADKRELMDVDTPEDLLSLSSTFPIQSQKNV